MGLFLENGTRVTQSTIVTAAQADPLVVVGQDLYQKSPYSNADTKVDGGKLTVFCRAGAVKRQSEINNMFPDPIADSILPATGVAAGGWTVTILGQYLDGVSAITVGGTAVTSFSIKSPTKITAVVPAKTAGAYPVVITDDGGSVTKTAALTYS